MQRERQRDRDRERDRERVAEQCILRIRKRLYYMSASAPLENSFLSTHMFHIIISQYACDRNLGGATPDSVQNHQKECLLKLQQVID